MAVFLLFGCVWRGRRGLVPTSAADANVRPHRGFLIGRNAAKARPKQRAMLVVNIDNGC
jgi:hypothetical protein